jgi:hypothetical protein
MIDAIGGEEAGRAEGQKWRRDDPASASPELAHSAQTVVDHLIPFASSVYLDDSGTPAPIKSRRVASGLSVQLAAIEAGPDGNVTDGFGALVALGDQSGDLGAGLRHGRGGGGDRGERRCA